MFLVEAGCTSDRRVRIDLAKASATPADSFSVLRGPALLGMIHEAGLEVPTLPRPHPRSATLAVAAQGGG
jgi:hypothetical protein